MVSTTRAQGGLKYKGTGYYWTKEGEKVKGDFKISYKTHLVGGSIIKHYVDNKKVGRVEISNLQSLIINEDSFIVGYNFTLDSWASYDFDILEVSETGKINLYIHRRKVKQGSGPNSIPIGYLAYSFVISNDKGKTFKGIATKKQFEEYFIPMISDNKKLLDRIQEMKKREWLDNLPFFIQDYNNS
jgi:hypothetical protein